MTNRRRRWLRRLAIGVSFAAFAAPAAAKPIPAKQHADARSGRMTGRIGSRSPSRRCSRAPRCDRTTARIGSRSPTELAATAGAPVRPDDRADRFAISDGASPATSSQHRKRLLGWGRDARARHARARPGARPRARLHPSAQGSPDSKFAGAAKRAEAGSSEPAFVWSYARVLRALGLACVQPLLEQDAKLLAGREHVRVAGPARGQLHDPNVVVPVAVTASVGSRFIERGQRRATAQEAHDWGIS